MSCANRSCCSTSQSSELNDGDICFNSGCFWRVIKYVMTALVSLTVTLTFVINKLTLISLAKTFHNIAATNGSGVFEERVVQTHETTGLLLYFTITTPYWIFFARALWLAFFSNKEKWPNCRGLLSCVLVGITEPVGVCFLLFAGLSGSGHVTCAVVLSSAVMPVIFENNLRQIIEKKRICIERVRSSILLLTSFAQIVYLFTSPFLRLQPSAAYMCVGLACLYVSSLQVWHQYMIDETASDKNSGLSPPEEMPGRNSADDKETGKTSDKNSGLSPPKEMPGRNSADDEETGKTSDKNSGLSPPKEMPGRNSADDEETEKTSDKNSGLSPPEKMPGRNSADDEETEKTSKSCKWRSSTILFLVKSLSTLVTCVIFIYVRSPGSYTVDQFTLTFDTSLLPDGTMLTFYVHVGVTFCSYLLVFLACVADMQSLGVTLPAALTWPLLLAIYFTASASNYLQSLVSVVWYQPTPFLHYIQDVMCSSHHPTPICNQLEIAAAALSTVSILLHFIRKKTTHDKRRVSESKIFRIPGYNSVTLESWVLVNRLEGQEVTLRTSAPRDDQPTIYICTTMYHEEYKEMKAYLESISKLQTCQLKKCQVHIFFDDGVTDKKINSFAKTLINLTRDTFRFRDGEKKLTPFGVKVSFRGKTSIPVTIYLKDNKKVRNKKRWSQVMYMNFVTKAEFTVIRGKILDENDYILATDGDVKFECKSLTRLVDFMQTNDNIGAVCSRTHPEGSGPVFWFQIFEFAIGHWFQKPAEHMFGSILCAPGCFSLYRCKYIEKVLVQYSTNQESALDFLIKDMGEDRWLCSLLIREGCGIDYCAASEVTTHCPVTFKEFFTQRRRWTASTMANVFLLLRDRADLRKDNSRVSQLFVIYLCLLFVSTILSPSVTVLLIAGGLVYAWDTSVVVALAIPLVPSVLYTLVCLFTSQKSQILVGQLLTFFYGALMCCVIVGTAREIVSDILDGDVDELILNSTLGSSTSFYTTTQRFSDISPKFHVSVSTVSILSIMCLMLVAGLLHGREVTKLIYGLVFLLALPSGYLLLLVYSACNLADSSWGTREVSHSPPSTNLITSVKNYLGRFFTLLCKKCGQEKEKTFNQESEDMLLNDVEQRSHNTLQDVSASEVHGDEDDFQICEDLTDPENVVWKKLIDKCLYPINKDLETGNKSTKSIEENLQKLRNDVVKILIAANTIWLVFICSFAPIRELYFIGSNPAGIIFLCTFGACLLLQFVALLCHRVSTLCHRVADATWC